MVRGRAPYDFSYKLWDEEKRAKKLGVLTWPVKQ
jgi:hypothetical protein